MKTFHFPVIDSTSLYIKNNISKMDSFDFVSTDYQTNGKGRNDRKWISNNNENLLFSFLIKDKNLVNQYQYLSLSVAAIIRRILIEYKIDNVQIKWPNDVFVNGKKICGILINGSIPNYLIVGVGLNVNSKYFDANYLNEPTSMYLESKSEINLVELKEKIFLKIEKYLINFDQFKEELINEAIKNNYLKGKKYKTILDNKEVVVDCLDINKDCSLSILYNNDVLNLFSGELIK